MKQLVRATAVAISVGIGVVAFGGVAHAWAESVSAHSACAGGAATITVSFTNTEPATADQTMLVSAADDQTGGTAIWGNGQSSITVAGGDTVTGTIDTHMATVATGTVRVTEHWANGREDHDAVVADYGSQDCTPVVPQAAFGATTEGAGGCNTTTGAAFVDWSVTNTGDVGVRTVATSLTGTPPNTLIAPGATVAMPTLHRAGTFAVASYTVDVEATDGRTATLSGNLTPTLTGVCATVIPPPTTPVAPVAQPTVLGATETAPTAVAPAATTPTVKAAAATLPFTGSADVPLMIAGFGILGLGLFALGTTGGAARMRRFGLAVSRIRTNR